MCWSGGRARSKWLWSESVNSRFFLALEQEVKLAFESIEAARQAIQIAGGRLVASRRLIDDQLYDRPGDLLQSAHCTLRIRRDGTRGFLTFKGPGLDGPVKIREEIETEVSDVTALDAIVTALGFRPFFRAQKYREEHEIRGASLAKIALDDTPMGTFVEIEAEISTIAAVAGAFGRSTDDYILSSYQRLFAAWAPTRGLSPHAMLVNT